MLTDSNVPRGHCVICLYNFQEGDSLTKTPCFHHFHSHCLGRYAEHSQEQAHISVLSVLCPVCREKVSCDLDKLRGALPPRNPEETYEPDSATLQKREELRRIYQVQLDKGGIIDLEAEKKRFFISIQEPQPSTDPILTSQSGDVPSTRPEDVPSTRPEDVPSTRPEDVPSTRPEDVLSTRPLDVPSTQPLDVPSTRPVDIPSTRPVDIPLTRPVDAPSQFVGSSSCQPEEVPFSQPKNVRTNKSLDVPSHKPVDIQSKQNKREFFPPLPNETNPPYSRGHSERQKSGYRNHFYRLPHYDHSDNSHLHRGRGRRPHGRARPERNERSGEVKPDISRGHGNPSRGNFKGRNFRTGGIVQRSSRGTEENVMTDNPS
ncbi:hypothetical protein GDO86_017597 [Hymenochirus boettgeri]|nr:hypothetical protein GDO86_017597 [Hymenochirus boettgeri]